MHSISVSGMALFKYPITSTLGGIEIDLASAPLDPGEHRLEIDSTIGGIEIFVPRYVKFTIEGGAVIGGYDVHDGAGLLGRLAHKLGLSRTPVRAVDNPDPTRSISIHFVISGGVGGIDIYRL